MKKQTNILNKWDLNLFAIITVMLALLLLLSFCLFGCTNDTPVNNEDNHEIVVEDTSDLYKLNLSMTKTSEGNFILPIIVDGHTAASIINDSYSFEILNYHGINISNYDYSCEVQVSNIYHPNNELIFINLFFTITTNDAWQNNLNTEINKISFKIEDIQKEVSVDININSNTLHTLISDSNIGNDDFNYYHQNISDTCVVETSFDVNNISNDLSYWDRYIIITKMYTENDNFKLNNIKLANANNNLDIILNEDNVVDINYLITTVNLSFDIMSNLDETITFFSDNIIMEYKLPRSEIRRTISLCNIQIYNENSLTNGKVI